MSTVSDCPTSKDKLILMSLNMFEEAELYNLSIICSNGFNRFSQITNFEEPG